MSDDEIFCSNCFAGMESSEHHEKCVQPWEGLQDKIVDIINEADDEQTVLGDQYGAAPDLFAIANAIIDGLGLTTESRGGTASVNVRSMIFMETPAESRTVGKWEKQ